MQTDDPEIPDLVTAEQAAEILQCTAQYVRKLHKKGTLRGRALEPRGLVFQRSVVEAYRDAPTGRETDTLTRLGLHPKATKHDVLRAMLTALAADNEDRARAIARTLTAPQQEEIQRMIQQLRDTA